MQQRLPQLPLQHLQFSAQGAWLKLEGGNIEVHGPGAMEFRASAKELTGPQGSSSSTVMSIGQMKGCAQASQDASQTLSGYQIL